MMLGLAHAHVDRKAVGRHYLHLGERQRRTNFGDGKSVTTKTLFYALHPAAALRWPRLHGDTPSRDALPDPDGGMRSAARRGGDDGGTDRLEGGEIQA